MTRLKEYKFKESSKHVKKTMKIALKRQRDIIGSLVQQAQSFQVATIRSTTTTQLPMNQYLIHQCLTSTSHN